MIFPLKLHNSVKFVFKEKSEKFQTVMQTALFFESNGAGRGLLWHLVCFVVDSKKGRKVK